MPKVALQHIRRKFLKEGNKYPYLVKCPGCRKEYFSLFDKMFIEHMGVCYWPCGKEKPEIEAAAENVLALIREIL